MESLRATYRDDEDDSSEPNDSQLQQLQHQNPHSNGSNQEDPHSNGSNQEEFEENGNNEEDDDDEGDDTCEDEEEDDPQPPKSQQRPNPPIQPSSDETDEDDDIAAAAPPLRKKQKPLSSFTSASPSPAATAAAEPPSAAAAATPALKKPKKKTKAVNVWTKSTSRKGKKKAKPSAAAAAAAGGGNQESSVLMPAVPRLPDKSDDSPEMKICLSKVHKAEKVELSEDRLSAGSTKGYRMVRATRGVLEGAWYFEIKVVNLGETGHTRLGWSTEKGDLQAPVGSDANSFGYRDVDGSKVHRAVREKYGEEGYFEGDVVGCYINLPDGGSYAPKRLHFGLYKEQKYSHPADKKEDPPKVVPGEQVAYWNPLVLLLLLLLLNY